MEYLGLFLFYFIIIYLIYLVTVILQNKKMHKFEKGKQVQFFVKTYGLDFAKISVNKFTHILAITNSIIMSLTILVVTNIDNIILKLLSAFVLLFPLILIGYSLLGLYIKHKMKEGK